VLGLRGSIGGWIELGRARMDGGEGFEDEGVETEEGTRVSNGRPV
jgi:hypothetical protein